MNTPVEFNWKAEIEFQGNLEELAKVSELLKEAPLKVKIWSRPFPFPGGWPLDWRVVIGEERAEKFLAGTNSTRAIFIKDIPGGIRDPHLHVGDQVILLDRARFKEIVADVSRELAARRVEQMTDYMDVMEGINPLVGS